MFGYLIVALVMVMGAVIVTALAVYACVIAGVIKHRKDGGPDSHVGGWFFELKRFFTVALLCFEPGSREAYHSHAFNSLSLVLGPGYLEERHHEGPTYFFYRWFFVLTRRSTLHQVYSHGTTYVLTIRGPWAKEWKEYVDGEFITLTHGRKVINEM